MSKALQYSSRVLKRYSFLKTDSRFIEAALNATDAQFLPYHDFYPFFNQKEPSKLWKFNRATASHASSLTDFLQAHQPRELVYMGLIPNAASSFAYGKYKGTPLFAIDITKHETVIPRDNQVIKCQDFRHFNDLTVDESSLLSLGKMMLHWLQTHKFCSICGHENEVIACGGQLHCTNESCSSNGRISNVSFPRTDPVVISAVTNMQRDKILLCKHRLPSLREPERNMYACVSGFMDPSETVENAVAREVWEETGLDVKHVEIISTQPWPFPNNIMIGCLAVVDDAQPLDLENDKELIEATWYPKEAVRRMLESDMDTYGLLRDSVTGIGLPNEKTIANRLIKACL